MAVQGIVVILPQTLLGFLAGERFRVVVSPAIYAVALRRR